MRQIVATRETGTLVIEKGETPTLDDQSVHISTAYSLISTGTEIEYIAKDLAEQQLLGYCAAGVIQQVGVAVTELAVGDRVIAMGWNYAVHSETIVVPSLLVKRIPDYLSFDSAIYAGIGATIEHVIDRSQILRAPSDALVIGAGLLGNLLAQRLVALGIRVVVCEPNAYRRAALQQVESYASMDDVHQSFQYLFYCTSHLPVAIDAINRLFYIQPDGSKRARITLVGRGTLRGFLDPSAGNIDIVMAARCGAGYRDEQYIRGQKFITAHQGEKTVDANLAAALAAVESGHIDTQSVTSHVFSCNDVVTAYDVIRTTSNHLGILIRY